MTIQTTITGNIGKNPELRYVNTREKGTQPVLNFSVEAASSRYNQETGQWETIGEQIWIKIAVWGKAAEKWADELTAGTRIALTGNLKRVTSKDQQGQTWENLELNNAQILGITPKPTTNTPDANYQNPEDEYPNYTTAPF